MSLPHQAPASADANGLDPAGRRYRVFISYSHSDTRWANWLLRRLEGYRVSARFHGRMAPIGVVERRIAPVFRDRDELPTTSALGETIRAALRQSATLVVICSPRSAKSRWVQEEIVAFKRLHGERRVFAFIVDGEPKIAGAENDCFSPALRTEVGADGELSGPPAEVVAADARPHGDGPRVAFMRLVAGLLGVGFDQLRQRELQRRNRRLTLIAAASVVGMVLTLGLAIVAWRARAEADLARDDARRRQLQAEDVLEFMVGNFRGELKKLGRLSLVDGVGDKAMAYFSSMDPRDLSDTSLLRHATALSQIGENRLDQARFAEADAAFLAAYARCQTLTKRNPRNGEMLFARAQVEYWLGVAHRKKGDLAEASRWLTAYRDSALQLVTLNPAKVEWQEELGYGHHNLAVLEMDRGRYETARVGFRAEMEILLRTSAARPNGGDPTLRFNVANLHSWLGSAAEWSGDFVEARARYEEQVRRLEALMAFEPGNVRWSVRLAEALGFTSDLAAISGRRAEALVDIRRSRDLIDPLCAKDPANRAWQRLALVKRCREAELLQAEGRLAEAARLAAEARAGIEKLVQADSSVREFVITQMQCWRLEAELQAAQGRPDAVILATRAVELGEKLLAADSSTSRNAHTSLLLTGATAAKIHHRAGDSATAEARWRRVASLAGPLLEQSRDWRLLDPAARALAGLGQIDQARALVGRLAKLGYRPLSPWPEAIQP